MRNNNEIVNILTTARKNKNISISELSRMTGVAKSSLSRYENKSRQFPLNQISDFSKALSLRPEFVLGFIDNEDKTNNNYIDKSNSNSLDINTIFSTNLNYYMKIENENLTTLSNSINVAYSTVSDWKHGRKVPRSKSLNLLANHFQIGISDLLKSKTNIKEMESTSNAEQNNIVSKSVQKRNISTNIQKYLKASKISQVELANAVSISKSTLSDYINLRSAPSFTVIQKIAKVLNVSPYDIDSSLITDNEVNNNLTNINRNQYSSIISSHITKKLSDSQLQSITDYIDFIINKE